MNTPVSFELAKLLKEKGFDDFTQIWYQHGEGISGCVEGKRDYYNRKGDIYTSAPTISDVCMWLYKKHLLWVYAHKDGGWWFPVIENYYDEDEQGTIIESLEGMPKILFNSPTEAYEAAIEYTLNNLVLTKNK